MLHRSWLPVEALTGPPLQAAIERALEEWAADWFTGGVGLRVGRLEPFVPTRSARVGTVTITDEDCAVAIAIKPSSLAWLRSKALDMRRDSRSGSELEKTLLAGFDKRLVRALASRVESALGIGAARNSPSQAPENSGIAIRAVVSDPAGVETLRLSVPLDHAARFRKSCLPDPRRREPLASLDSAIGRSRLKLCGRLGSAELSFTELNDLSIGDVLVLDRRIDDLVELLADGEMRPVARALLESAERMTVTVQ